MTKLRILAFLCVALLPVWAQAQLPPGIGFAQSVFIVDATGRIITKVKSFHEPTFEFVYGDDWYEVWAYSYGPGGGPGGSIDLYFTDANCSSQPYLRDSIRPQIDDLRTIYFPRPGAVRQSLRLPSKRSQSSTGAGPCQTTSLVDSMQNVVSDFISVPDFMTNYPLPWRLTTSPFTNGAPTSNVPVPGLFTAPAMSPRPGLTIAR